MQHVHSRTQLLVAA